MQDILYSEFIYVRDERTLYTISSKDEDNARYYLSLLCNPLSLDYAVPSKFQTLEGLVRHLLIGEYGEIDLFTVLVGIYVSTRATTNFKNTINISPIRIANIDGTRIDNLGVLIFPTKSMESAQRILSSFEEKGEGELENLQMIPVLTIIGKDRLHLYVNEGTKAELITYSVAVLVKQFEKVFALLENDIQEEFIIHNAKNLSGLAIFIKKLAIAKEKNQTEEFNFLIQMLETFNKPPTEDEARFLTSSNITLE